MITFEKTESPKKKEINKSYVYKRTKWIIKQLFSNHKKQKQEKYFIKKA